MTDVIRVLPPAGDTDPAGHPGRFAAGPEPVSGSVASAGRKSGAQAKPMLHAMTWLFRGGGAVLIGAATFGYSAASGRDLVIEAVAFAIGAVVVAYWLVTDLRPEHRQPRVLAGALIASAAASGFASMGAHGGPLIGFAFMAAIGAGAGSSLLTGCVTTAIALAGVEVGALVTGASATSALGFPLLLIVAFVSGRNRAAYRRQAEQSATLVAQMEQLRAEQRRAAVLDERTRIAREIHDVLAHSLGALGIQLQAARALMAEQGDTGRALGLLDQAQRMATDGLAETRRAVHALRAGTAGLDEELATLASTHRTRHHASVSFRVDGQPRPLPPEATIALIRTAQEALVNAAKHAPFQPVDVGLHYRQDGVQMIITNPLPSGRPGGPSPGPEFTTVNGGYGLRGMRERLLLISGSLTAASGGGRWTVTAQVPR
ncbi:MAG TPA: histidine kinase [Streptosporangiaceae bacterium]|nr:histidine kinase [Streptosporangiaceae bacterium]